MSRLAVVVGLAVGLAAWALIAFIIWRAGARRGDEQRTGRRPRRQG